MTMTERSWGGSDTVVLHPFEFYGMIFHAKPPSMKAVRILTNMSDGDVGQMVASVVAFVAACLPAAERDAWHVHIDGDDTDVSVGDLRDLCAWIAGLAGADPLDRSLRGPTSNGATSEGDSTSQGYTTDPIPTS